MEIEAQLVDRSNGNIIVGGETDFLSTMKLKPKIISITVNTNIIPWAISYWRYTNDNPEIQFPPYFDCIQHALHAFELAKK